MPWHYKAKGSMVIGGYNADLRMWVFLVPEPSAQPVRHDVLEVTPGQIRQIGVLLKQGTSKADALYQEAVQRLAAPRLTLYRARAQLLYGEWLRREGRRVDAREQLQAAHEAFEAMGAEGFLARARRELAGSGATVRRRTVEDRDELTAQEAQIARLAAEGNTNPEIGALLFISPRTVEWHLKKIYTKLGISSRRQLRRVLPDAPRAAAAT